MSESGAPVKTPVHLWVVGIIAVLWNAMGCFDYLMTQTQNEGYMSQFSEEQLEYFYGFPAWAVSAWAIAVWGGLLGSVLLLMRRKLAVPVFIVSFVGMVVSMINSYVLSDGFEIMGGMAPVIFTFFIFVISLGLIVYSKRMAARGVLG